MSRVLSIDYGTVRVGLAISDELRILAHPIGVIPHSVKLTAEIIALIKKEQVGAVLVGLPKSLSGADSEMTKEVRTFADKLFLSLDAIGVQHHFYDERLTSMMAAGNILEQGLSKKKRQQKYRHDEEAARIILQEYLDSHR